MRKRGPGFNTAFRVVFTDELTVARLLEMAEICHATPEQVIAALTSDVLQDDALAHDNFVPESITLH